VTRVPSRIRTNLILATLPLALLGLPAAASQTSGSDSADAADSSAVAAAPDATTTDTAGRGFLSRSRCFPGLPGSDCPGFMLTEVTYGKRLHQESGLADDYLMLELGYMKSLGGKAAWGISASNTWSEDQRYGLHAHYRRWLNPHFSLDLSPGVWASGESMFDNRFDHLGVSARADLMWEETFGVGVEMDSGNPVGQRAGTEWKTAFRAGGYASVVAAGALALFAVMYAIAVSDPNY
jgi:hypothetical protein